jgi:hypothetical protein
MRTNWKMMPEEMQATDQSGKVFRVEQGMRRCMVCEELFIRETAAQHANVACWPEKQFGSPYGAKRKRTTEFSSE